MYYIYSYFFVSILVALRLGWYMYRRLDQYLWRYNKDKYWFIFSLFSLLWPLLLIRPKNLFSPEDLFNVNRDLAAGAREREELYNHPPLCGAVIFYRQKHESHENSFGEFEFDSAEVEKALRDILQESPYLTNDDEGALLKWVTARDSSNKAPTEVPDAWLRFQYVADNLIRSGKTVRSYCSMCEQEMVIDQLQQDDDQGHRSGRFNRLVCPNGHTLLAVESMHLYIK